MYNFLGKVQYLKSTLLVQNCLGIFGVLDSFENRKFKIEKIRVNPENF